MTLNLRKGAMSPHLIVSEFVSVLCVLFDVFDVAGSTLPCVALERADKLKVN